MRQFKVIDSMIPLRLKVTRNRFCALALAVGLTLPIACHRRVQVAQVGPASPPPATKPDLVLAPPKTPFTFIAYGDIRFSAVDRLREAEVSSSFARRAIVDAIAKEHPAFVLISGDLVWRGAKASDWKYWDKETKPLYDAGIPVLPTIGNHEFMTSQLVGNGRAAGLKNYYQRFPDIPHRPDAPWYAAQYANCYFLLLDTIDDDAPGSPQWKWFESQLDALPPTIEYVFIVQHRPPYTSATDGRHRPRQPELELARMLERRQQKSSRPRFVVIAGHVHNYERFEKNGVIYIVSGGGGAHPYDLVRSSEDLFHPAVPREIEFHYCLFTVEKEKVKFEMYRLADQRPPKFEVRDTFEFSAK